MTGMPLQGSQMLMSAKESSKPRQQSPSLYLRYSLVMHNAVLRQLLHLQALPCLNEGPCEGGSPRASLHKVSDLQDDDEMEKRVTRKLHMHIMSRFCLLTILNHMDRANLVKPCSMQWPLWRRASCVNF